MLIANTSIARPVTTLLFTMATLAFGYIALQNLGIDLFPEVEFPMVTVTSVLPGADPEIMDSDVTDVLEEYINTIEGIKNIRSISGEGQSQIVVEFVLSKDVDVAAQEIRDKINQAQRELPLDLEPPIVQKLDIASQPIMWIAVTSAGDYRVMTDFADNVLKERLQTISGVGSVQMGGFRKREIRVWLLPDALESRGLTPADVMRAIRTKHIELPGGRIEQPELEFAVKISGEYESVEELHNLVVAEAGGAVVRLAEVARVMDGFEDLRGVARFNGLPSIGLGVRKQSGTNTVAVAGRVRDILPELAREAPDGVHVQLAFDSSRFIETSMNDVIFDLFLGGLLTSVVMLVFLRNFRMTFISVVTIPASIIGAFVAMYALGFTINNMTMLALSLAIGIVIDDAIVVLENIFRHVEQEGKAAMAAAREGTDEIGFAVIAASSSIIAVFLPVAFMPGIIGRFFFQFGLTVTLAVLISVVVSLTLIPMLCSRLLKHNPNHGRVFRSFELGFRAMERFYGWALDKALRHRWLTLLAAVTFFVVGVGLIPFVKQEFSTQADESRFMVRFELPTGTSLAASEQALRKLEETLFAQEEVRSAFAVLGLDGGVNSGLMFVNLLRPWEREATQNEVITRLRDLLRKAVPSALVAVEVISPIGGGQRNADLQFIVQGPTVASLEEVTARMLADMRATAGFVDIDSDLRLSKPEVRLSIDRNLADDLGVDVMTIVETFNALFAGADVAKFKEGSKRYDIRVRAAPEARVQPQDINRIVVRAASGALVSSPNLVTFEEGLGPDKINRYNRQRSVTLFANLDGVALGEALQAMEAVAERHVPPGPGWSTALGGASEAFAESFLYLFYALIIAILVIYVVLGSQFESFIHPFTVLMSVPLAVIGGIGLLLVTGKTLDIFSFIGFVMLIGIVTKNAILLLDFTNQMRQRGVPRDEALRRAGPLRLRPILMTAFTTMAAVLPVALAISEGGESRAPMGVAVIGGMMTSTLLTLLVIPCVYTVMDDMIAAVGRVFGLASPAGPHGAEKQTEVQ